MADAIRIEVYPKRRNPIATTVQTFVFWGSLVGAVGLSRVWFGGAWVIVLPALLMLFIAVIAYSMKLAGKTVSISRDENAAWVAAGMPRDVKAWKDARDV